MASEFQILVRIAVPSASAVWDSDSNSGLALPQVAGAPGRPSFELVAVVGVLVARRNGTGSGLAFCVRGDHTGLLQLSATFFALETRSYEAKTSACSGLMPRFPFTAITYDSRVSIRHMPAQRQFDANPKLLMFHGLGPTLLERTPHTSQGRRGPRLEPAA